jgi:4'-phosphopantetheinyl transferase
MTAVFGSGAAPGRTLDVKTIDVWTVALDAPLDQSLTDLLSADEVARAERFVFERDRRRFLACRRALRQVLSSYVGVPPQALAFVYGGKGKPALEDASSGLRFNVSHSEECAVIGVSRSGELGIDVECTTRTVDFEGLAERFFSREEAAEFCAVPAASRRQAFFNGWTRKEAYIKAIGEGLACPLDSFAVTLEPGASAGFRRIDGDAVDAWRLWAFSPSDLYVGAVATRAKIDAIRLKRFASTGTAVQRVQSVGATTGVRA